MPAKSGAVPLSRGRSARANHPIGRRVGIDVAGKSRERGPTFGRTFPQVSLHFGHPDLATHAQTSSLEHATVDESKHNHAADTEKIRYGLRTE